jgi:hypothetical protein
MEAPSSTAGRVAASFGILGAGAAVGAGAAALYVPATAQTGSGVTPQTTAIVTGSVLGILAAATGAAAAAVLFGGGWAEVEEMTAALGLGIVATAAAYQVTQVFPQLQESAQTYQPTTPQTPTPATPASPTTGALPPRGAGKSQNYTGDTSVNGGSLTLRVGDTVTLTMPGKPGTWSWAATPNLAWQSEATSLGNFGEESSLEVFRANAPGKGQLQAQMSPDAAGSVSAARLPASQSFAITVTVVA